ncbi:CS1 type fimbrial major subunit [Burkholderia multivorans]|uniref:CS1 type fimbrial major subunit n=1 Tax=Burkholderia multivorans TaxID=87883 RepID=UPI000CFEA0FE|nr:CS1 type fimbrial major subunit [Burkholderia multivorans]MBU9143334.1 fimbrial protein [Burkholderia multivorans]MBU9181755.1 fimbrial protein [Burkholderia multivorans]MCA8338069.1 fimbrial protein [Burkholderia multivorans]MDN7477315.1 CS1 type fimbrial major subunit [Burkholderia multivorans]PRE04264.1 fimbrial assembly protein [Burkholderia multivorans]
MKIKQLVVALGVSGALIGLAHAAPANDNQVSKKITLTAQINDGIFVSKPDGSSWYSTEELEAVDYKQAKFQKTLPIRVWTKGADFNVSLAQELKLSSGNGYSMVNPVVTLASAAGSKTLAFGKQEKITQVVTGNGGYDELHDLTIAVDAPTAVGNRSTNGSYSGDLVMVFEPVAAAGGGGAGGAGE